MVRVYRGDRIWDWIRHVSGEPPIVLPSEQVSGGPVGGASARGKRRRERARSLLRRRAVRRAARPAIQNRNGGGGGLERGARSGSERRAFRRRGSSRAKPSGRLPDEAHGHARFCAG